MYHINNPLTMLLTGGEGSFKGINSHQAAKKKAGGQKPAGLSSMVNEIGLILQVALVAERPLLRIVPDARIKAGPVNVVTGMSVGKVVTWIPCRGV